MDTKDIKHLTGLGNIHQSEAHPGSLPTQQNSPQQCPHGLYAEQLSGSAFSEVRSLNLFTWLYRIRPSVTHRKSFTPYEQPNLVGAPFNAAPIAPAPFRWNPLPFPETSTDLLDGLFTLAGCGDAKDQSGAAIHWYACNQSMEQRFVCNQDGEWLVVPQAGALRFATECGELEVAPGEMLVIPRGMKWTVTLLDEQARGYICENYGAPFRLPELGVMGANGLANPRHFKIPVADYHDTKLNKSGELICKFQDVLWTTPLSYSPLDVVAWWGNYVPYKYDLSLFNTINTVSFDHPDPSIFTVLTSPSTTPNVSNLDFVIFPPRWMVAEHTFRPPYYHNNVMSEFMGLVKGLYDAKPNGFLPGGASLHNAMVPHGPDAESFKHATKETLKPEYYDDTLAFMFESQRVWRPTEQALSSDTFQKDYQACWKDLGSHFKK